MIFGISSPNGLRKLFSTVQYLRHAKGCKYIHSFNSQKKKYEDSCFVDKETVTEKLNNLLKSHIWKVLKQGFDFNLHISRHNVGLWISQKNFEKTIHITKKHMANFETILDSNKQVKPLI